MHLLILDKVFSTGLIRLFCLFLVLIYFSGLLIIRNTPWAREFIVKWWDVVDRNVKCDQDAFDVLYRQVYLLIIVFLMVISIYKHLIKVKDQKMLDQKLLFYLEMH